MTWSFLVIAGLFLPGFVQPKLVKTKIAEGITVLIPDNWRPMDDLDFTDRYPSVRAPLGAFTDADRLVDFSVNISATRWPDANLAMAQQFFKASVMNMFDRVEMISEGIHEVNGKQLIYFEFESRVNGDRSQEGFQDPIVKYAYIQYLVQPGRTLVFAFNCPARLQEEWQPIAQKMMKSIKIK